MADPAKPATSHIDSASETLISTDAGITVGASSSGRLATPPSPIPDVVLEGELGRGGMGVVYRGRQVYLDRKVAVKLLLVEGAEGQEFVRRFQREAKILASLAHPNIVSCYQAGITAANNPYLVMEFIDGPTLKGWIDENGRVPVKCAVAITRDIARALDHAHQSGVIHRDVKPENVLLAKKPAAAADDPFPYTAKLVDLGLARPSSNAAGEMNLTRQGAVMGTPATMAPEQFDDPDNVDFRADIYGLGCVLYHALVGRAAYDGRTLAQIVTAKVNGEVPQPTKAKADVPLAVNELVTSLLARDREARPQSYQVLIDRCDLMLGQSTELIGRQGNRAAWIGVGAAVLILGGAAAWFASQQAPAPQPGTPVPGTPTAPSKPAAPPTPSTAQVVPAAQTVPLTAFKDSDWDEAKPLWNFDQAQRLKVWTTGEGALWSSAEDRDDAVAGVSGRIMRQLPGLPCRIQGVVHHTQGAQKSDKAQVGVLLADGGRIDLTVTNLGAINFSALNCYRNGQEDPYTTQGPVSLPAKQGVPFSLIIREDGFLAAVDGNPFTLIPLSSPPKELYLGAEGKQAPVEVSALTVRMLKAK